MKRIIVTCLFIAFVASCKKEEPVKSKPYNIEYKILVTPLDNSTINGTVSYISKTSATSSASVSNSGWILVENNWNLNIGDKVGFTARVANFATVQASIIVDGSIMIFQNGAQTFPTSTNLNLYYTIQ